MSSMEDDRVVLRTTMSVIEVLGGAQAVADMLEDTTTNSVYNWRVANRFPANTYPALREALARKNILADEALWPMVRLREAP